MGLPGQRRSRSDKRRRSAHFALKPTQTVTCPQCDKPVLPHRACTFCGTYRGRQVIDKVVATTKKKPTPAKKKPVARAKKTTTKKKK